MNFSTMVEARSDPNFKHNLLTISFLQIHNIYVAVNFLSQVIFLFLLFQLVH